MYADRIEGDSKPSIKDRLNGSVSTNAVRRRPLTGKRQRQDDKWEHDLYEDQQPQISRKLGGGDLRLKLQRRSNQQVTQGGAVRDLREKLSGSMHSQPVNKDPPKPKPGAEAAKPARRSVIVATPVVDKKISNTTSKKKTQQKVDASIDGFLQSLGLEKYLITFQAEEVDMTALEHMTDEDLKAMGIPMGPRKKILLALSSKG
ncbi:SEC23-interacting protein [Bienertia sinuspersici]